MTIMTTMDGQGQSDTTAINTVTAESTPTTVVEVEMANANNNADAQQSEQPNSQQLQQQQTIEPTPMSIVEPESQQKEQMLPPSTNSSLPVTEAAATTAVCNGVIEKESQQQTSNSAFEPYRAKQLLAAIDKAIERVGKSLSFTKLQSCFPSLSTDNPTVLAAALKQVSTQISQAHKEEIQAILDHDHVVRLLDELDVLIDEAKKENESAEKAVSPSLLPPSQIARAHRYRVKLAERSRLQSELVALSNTHSTQKAMYDAKMNELTAALAVVSEYANELETRVKVLENVGMEECQNLKVAMMPAVYGQVV